MTGTLVSEAVPGRLVLASGNAGKLAELRALVGHLNCEVLSLAEFSDVQPEETGSTFVENALIKARNACEVSSLPALADDSGIVVDALDGRPGVHSARFAGQQGDDEANLQLLLSELRGVPAAERTARFVSVVVYLRHRADPLPVVAVGRWEGSILEEPRGTNGFGYDPVFVPSASIAGSLPGQPPHVTDAASGPAAVASTSAALSAAELSAEQKNVWSHRGRALATLLHELGW